MALAIGIAIAASGSGLFFGRRKWSRVILGLALPVVGLAMSTGVLLAMAKHHWFHAVGWLILIGLCIYTWVIAVFLANNGH